MRIEERSGSGGGSGAGGAASTTSATATGTGTGSGAGAGGAAHAANSSAIQGARFRARLITQPDSHDVNFCLSQTASRHIQFVEVIDRPDVDAVVISIVDAGTLYS